MFAALILGYVSNIFQNLTQYAGGPAPTVPATADGSDGSDGSLVDNPFLPEDANIGDCVSSVPRPGCGSEARGGWRQWLILLALVGGLGVIGWRIVAGVRRRADDAVHRPAPDGAADEPPVRAP